MLKILDLGIRLIKDGYKLAFLSSVAVIHSHNRPAFYYLKRGYVDILFLDKILPDFTVLNCDYESLINDICLTFYNIDQIITGNFSKIRFPIEVTDFMDYVTDKFKTMTDNRSFEKPDFKSKYTDIDFTAFLQKYCAKQNLISKNNFCESGLGHSIIDIVTTILEYINTFYNKLDYNTIEDFKSAVFKFFALLCGNYFAYCFIKNTNSKNDALTAIHNELNTGI